MEAPNDQTSKADAPASAAAVGYVAFIQDSRGELWDYRIISEKRGGFHGWAKWQRPDGLWNSVRTPWKMESEGAVMDNLSEAINRYWGAT